MSTGTLTATLQPPTAILIRLRTWMDTAPRPGTAADAPREQAEPDDACMSRMAEGDTHAWRPIFER